MTIASHVNVAISVASAAVDLPGFGRPAIFATPGAEPAGWAPTERRRLYTSAADMLTDGWLTSDQEYLMGVAITSQRPRPADFMVVRRDTAVAQITDVTVTTGTYTGTFTITLNGSAVTFVAAADNQDAVATGLEAALAAHPDIVGGSVTDGVVANVVTLTSATAGIPMVVSATGPATPDITVADTTASVGTPQDIAALNNIDPNWYVGHFPEQDRLSIVRAIAPTFETQNRLASVDSNEAAILTLPYDSGDIDTDIASELKGLGYKRTMVWYHSSAIAFLAAAMSGKMLPTEPGTATWKFKTPAGVAAPALTATERANMLSKGANSLETVAGRVISFDGTVAEGEWIDVMRGIDKLQSLIEANIFGAQVSMGKIPFTQSGLDLVGGHVSSAMLAMTSKASAPNLLADTRVINNVVEAPGWTVTVPNIGTFSAATRETREIISANPVSFEGTLAGAIHTVFVTGTVTF